MKSFIFIREEALYSLATSTDMTPFYAGVVRACYKTSVDAKRNAWVRKG